MRYGLRSSIAALLSVFATACSQSLPTSAAAPHVQQTAPAAPQSLVALQGHVDLAKGTMSIGGPAFDGVAQSAIYGDQNVTLRLYNSGVVRTNAGSKRLYTATVGIRNLRNHPIGDEEGGLAPLDTMGISIFFTALPVVTGTSSPCTSCSVRVANAHGVSSFTGLNQPFFHYHERLGAAGSKTDTTQRRMVWVFEADSAVTTFAFNVLVSAAWPAPYESSWSVGFFGDTLPSQQSAPRWSMVKNGPTPFATSGGGSLTIQMGSPLNYSDLYYERRDSLDTRTMAFAEARLRLEVGTGDPHTFFGFDDNTKWIAIGISTKEVGFIDDGYGFIEKVSITTNVNRTYQLRKFGRDSVQLWIDGTRRLTVPYSKLKSNPANNSAPSFFRFGAHGKDAVTNRSVWDYVVYHLGRATP